MPAAAVASLSRNLPLHLPSLLAAARAWLAASAAFALIAGIEESDPSRHLYCIAAAGCVVLLLQYRRLRRAWAMTVLILALLLTPIVDLELSAQAHRDIEFA